MIKKLVLFLMVFSLSASQQEQCFYLDEIKQILPKTFNCYEMVFDWFKEEIKAQPFTKNKNLNAQLPVKVIIPVDKIDSPCASFYTSGYRLNCAIQHDLWFTQKQSYGSTVTASCHEVTHTLYDMFSKQETPFLSLKGGVTGIVAAGLMYYYKSQKGLSKKIPLAFLTGLFALWYTKVIRARLDVAQSEARADRIAYDKTPCKECLLETAQDYGYQDGRSETKKKLKLVLTYLGWPCNFLINCDPHEPDYLRGLKAFAASQKKSLEGLCPHHLSGAAENPLVPETTALLKKIEQMKQEEN
jgi:hypothetical protein